MNVRFEETMRGSYRTADGRERLLQFNLKAVGRLGLNTFRVIGAIRADGLKTVGPCSGNISLSLRMRGTIAYDLEFRGDDGGLYGLTGAKDFHPLRPLRSLTTLPVTVVSDDGQPVGEGSLRLEARDIIRFLRSFRFGS